MLLCIAGVVLSLLSVCMYLQECILIGFEYPEMDKMKLSQRIHLAVLSAYRGLNSLSEITVTDNAQLETWFDNYLLLFSIPFFFFILFFTRHISLQFYIFISHTHPYKNACFHPQLTRCQPSSYLSDSICNALLYIYSAYNMADYWCSDLVLSSVMV